jgi:chain length determinant protein tyrosine kinase EpsG
MRNLRVAPAGSETESTEKSSAGELPRLGSLLMDEGLIDGRDVSSILAQQHKDERRFGDVAVGMGLVDRAEVDAALARQIGVDFRPAIGNAVDALLLPGGAGEVQNEVMRSLRSQLVLRWFGNEPEQRTLAVLSRDGGEGRSHVCAHLALMLAQMDEDTLIIDADLRKPSLHRLFSIDSPNGLGDYLARDIDRAPIHAVAGHPRLHLLPAGPSRPDALPLLERRPFAQLLAALSRRYAFILIDTPPAAQFSEAMTVAVRSSGCLLVMRRHRTRLSDAQRLADELGRHSVEVLGAVINER